MDVESVWDARRFDELPPRAGGVVQARSSTIGLSGAVSGLSAHLTAESGDHDRQGELHRAAGTRDCGKPPHRGSDAWLSSLRQWPRQSDQAQSEHTLSRQTTGEAPDLSGSCEWRVKVARTQDCTATSRAVGVHCLKFVDQLIQINSLPPVRCPLNGGRKSARAQHHA
jgi:hypothetical protein